jgi:hypothetical protein
MEMSQESTTARAERLINERRFEKERVFTERSDNILNEEDTRRAADAAKTARLRELRLAKEAEERATKAAQAGASLRKGKS